MAIRSQPEMVDMQGFRRRSWEFDWESQTYLLHQTEGPLLVLKKMPDASWQPLEAEVTQAIIAAFKAEHQASMGDFE